VTYALRPEVLQPRVPEELELDTIDGDAFASLVAFDFLDTRVKRISWPGFRNFPEINLRFYVREKESGRRGVMFVRELVPSSVVAWIARTLYNEPYAATSMRSNVERSADGVTVDHHWDWVGTPHHLRVQSAPATTVPATDSTEHFFKEHQWGYGSTRGGETIIYEVRHPHWAVHEVRDYTIDVDFAGLYGSEFDGLSSQDPVSVVHAVGSEIEVYGHARLQG
jgi:uncharacterized protein YqjF (DUF2071 family)